MSLNNSAKSKIIQLRRVLVPAFSQVSLDNFLPRSCSHPPSDSTVPTGSLILHGETYWGQIPGLRSARVHRNDYMLIWYHSINHWQISVTKGTNETSIPHFYASKHFAVMNNPAKTFLWMHLHQCQYLYLYWKWGIFSNIGKLFLDIKKSFFKKSAIFLYITKWCFDVRKLEVAVLNIHASMFIIIGTLPPGYSIIQLSYFLISKNQGICWYGKIIFRYQKLIS